ncbi:substrate-binding periplasmic protein [Xylophilus sp. ASV27]|uniref:substrate-binding periplasmic protein n=1 Tax=Xylophilus sp. ASV27 TaxID=2795129 RepID=UPI0018ED1DC9|nr:transporter substrate-binding domain-containing protein [Xylophilus sp. ASV27]
MPDAYRLRFLRRAACGLLLAGIGGAAGAQALRVVTEATAYTFDENGTTPGPATALVRATLERADIHDYRLDLYPWARAYDKALNEPNVLIYLIARTPEREPLFLWTAEVLRIQYHLYRLAERSDIRVASLADAQRYVVGVVRDDLRHEYLRKRGFTRLTVSAQEPESMRRLLARQVDLLPLAEIDAEQLCRDTRPRCTGLVRVLTLDELTGGLYMAYSRGTAPALVERTREAFAQLSAEGAVQRAFAGLPGSAVPEPDAPHAVPAPPKSKP